MKKQRLDVKMAELGLAESREKAKALILAGQVLVGGVGNAKPSDMIGDEAIELKARLPFVSRGGLKLQKALDSFAISVDGLVCLDVGASTGGFTDCLLQRGARRVFALDVGYGQLDWRLREDARVTVFERRNARHMEPAWFEETPAFACMDVSFISIRLILPALYACLSDGARLVSLIKPQFEAGREKVGKKGVVSDANTHIEVVERAVSAVKEAGFSVLSLDFSPIRGPEGNIEYLMAAVKGTPNGNGEPSGELDAASVVKAAHGFF